MVDEVRDLGALNLKTIDEEVWRKRGTLSKRG